jgi:hypothetical protein
MQEADLGEVDPCINLLGDLGPTPGRLLKLLDLAVRPCRQEVRRGGG